MSVRVRFAPSPTGHLHVGGARTALFNWLFARHNKGQFILRIEDTDTARSTKESEKMVLEDLKWLGLEWDEGPDNGGPHAPYRQSERMDIYNEYANKLLQSKLVYRCYCTDEELQHKRDEAFSLGAIPQYDGTCRNLSLEEQKSKEAQGLKAAIRFIVPKGAQHLDDLIRGHIDFPEGMVGDFIIIKQDGLPTYNFAATVDDALMKISHVLRAEEHLSNTNRQLMLFKALKLTPPQYAHFSLVMGRDEDGKISKLSKRHGATSVAQYKELGYLPHALLNYLVLIGWSHPEGKEKMTSGDMISGFDLSRNSKSAGIFDPAKLNWMSGLYIREMPLSDAARSARVYLDKAGFDISGFGEEKFLKAVDAVRSHLNYFSEIPSYFSIFLDEDFKLENDAKEMLSTPGAKDVVKALRAEIASGGDITAELFKEMQNRVKGSTGKKGKELFHPMRAAITGKLSGPELHLVVPVLGKESCLARIDKALKEV